MSIFRKKYPLGVIAPDYRDARDYQLAEVQAETADLPESFSLMGKMTPVQTQNWGTCTSHMADGLKEFLDSQEYGKQIKLSQKFIYYNTKKISGLWDYQGDYLRNALKSVCQYGACLEKTFPDVKGRSWREYVKEEPPPTAYTEAKEFKAKSYWRVGKTLNDFRQAVYQQKAPVGFGMMWHKSYNRPASDGRLPLPDKKAGGHAVVCVGWTGNKLWIRNSWGVDWGYGGYFYIPFEEFDRHEIWDCWVLLDIEKSKVLEGWVAGKYLKRVGFSFKPGDLVTPVYRLNLRKYPAVRADRITTLNPGTKLTVVSDPDNGTRSNGYVWFKVKGLNK